MPDKGGRSSRPLDKGEGGRSPKKIFRFGLKIRGDPGPCLGSATALLHNYPACFVSLSLMHSFKFLVRAT